MFYFIKKRHPASKTLRRPSNPPFLRSITLWNNPRYRTLWLTRFANLTTLFRRNSLIQTEKCSLFREKKCPQSFLNVQIIILHAIRYFCKKKFWFNFNRAQSWMIMRCLLCSAVFRSVTARTENIFTSGHKPEITKGNNSTVYRVRMSNHREIQTISSTGIRETSGQNWFKIGILLLHSLTHFDDICDFASCRRQ